MLQKRVWLVFKILEFLLTLACSWLLWRCCLNHNHSQIRVLGGFYGFASIMSLGLLIAAFFMEPIRKFEAEQSFILGILHMIAIYMHLDSDNKELCTKGVLVALWVTALYLMHCNVALDQIFSDEQYPEDPLMMPPFYFRRAGGSQVFICEPLPSSNGPTGLPPIFYEEI
ncbi:hypothetical protein KR032_003903 [Drosophila birchii]|nr:hypothetical protein KR032_003903 [Drosophila birchii]